MWSGSGDLTAGFREFGFLEEFDLGFGEVEGGLGFGEEEEGILGTRRETKGFGGGA